MLFAGADILTTQNTIIIVLLGSTVISTVIQVMALMRKRLHIVLILLFYGIFGALAPVYFKKGVSLYHQSVFILSALALGFVSNFLMWWFLEKLEMLIFTRSKVNTSVNM